VHEARAGETERLTGEALETSAQCEVLTLDLLHRQFPDDVLLGRKMPPIDTRLVCIVTSDAERNQQGAEFQECRILPGANDVCEHSSRAMIDRMPQPPRSCFGPDITPHFIDFDCALWPDAPGACV